MSFEKLNETSMNNVHDRSCIIIVNVINIFTKNNIEMLTEC